MKKLVLVGGGHAHVEVLRQFGLRAPDGVALTLVSPDRHTPYSGMLPGLVAGHYTFDECHIDLAPLAQFSGARFVQSAVRAIDPAQHTLTLADGSTLAYDIASINVGSTPPNLEYGIVGAADYTIAVKPVPLFLARWEKLIERVFKGEVRSLAMVGGGAAGAEMLLSMRHRLLHAGAPHALRYVLVMQSAQPLANHARGVRTVFARHLARKQIEVHRATRIERVEDRTLIADNGVLIPVDAIFLATGAQAPGWVADSGLTLNESKFLNINKYLQSINHNDVFAAGDCATIEGHVYPKSGVYAVRQGPPLAENLRRALIGDSLIEYAPQPRTLALISTGEQHAIASYGALALHGNWVWRWKNQIDRRFMAKYRPPWR